MTSQILKFSLALYLLAFISISEAATPKQNVIKKVKNLLTTFCTDAQLSKLLDFAAEEIYQGKTVNQLLADSNEIVKYFMSTLTSQQMATAMTALSGLQKDLGSGWQNALNKTIAVLQQEIAPLYNKILNKVKTMKKNKKNKNQCYNQGYTMANNFFTKQRVKTIMQKLKKQSTAAEWQAVKKNLGSLIKFGQYGL